MTIFSCKMNYECYYYHSVVIHLKDKNVTKIGILLKKIKNTNLKFLSRFTHSMLLLFLFYYY